MNYIATCNNLGNMALKEVAISMLPPPLEGYNKRSISRELTAANKEKSKIWDNQGRVAQR